MPKLRRKKPEGLDAILHWVARRENIFGSDIYVSYSHQYVWQANQIGHVFIGLFAGLVLGFFACSPVWAFLGVAGVYFVKELIDYLIAVRLQEGVFPVDRLEAARDGVTDWLFVVFGAVIAAVLGPVAVHCASGLETGLDGWWAGLIGRPPGWLPGLIAFALPAGFFLLARNSYLPRKRAFDKSGMPHYLRLPTFPENFGAAPGEVPEGLAERLTAFAAGTDGPGQLIVAGPPGSGRTTLGLSLGGEATNKRRKVRYLNGGRLIEKARDGETPAAPGQPWQVAEADLVIVDNVGRAGAAANTEAALAELAQRLCGEDAEKPSVFQRPIGARTEPRPLPGIVWILADGVDAARFRAAIAARLGVQEADCELVKLREKLPRVRTAGL